MDVTLESSVVSLYAVGVSLDKSDVSRQLVGVTLESEGFDDPASESVVTTSPSSRQSEECLPVSEDEPLSFSDFTIPVGSSTPVKQGTLPQCKHRSYLWYKLVSQATRHPVACEN